MQGLNWVVSETRYWVKELSLDIKTNLRYNVVCIIKLVCNTNLHTSMNGGLCHE
jgi:hypothetical protein